MQRLARYLPTLLFCLSAAAATLCVRSYCSYDQFKRESWSTAANVASHSRIALLSGDGTVYFSRYLDRVHLQEPPVTRPATSVSEWKSIPPSRNRYMVNYLRDAARDKSPAWAQPLARVGLGYCHQEKHSPNRGDRPRGPIASTNHAAALPYWVLVTAPALWPTLTFSRRATRAWIGRRRRLAGRCAGCGYDLRGSTTLCPECGMACGAGSAAALPARSAPGRGRTVLVVSFLTACIVACVLNVRAAARRAPPPLAEERARLDRMVSKEVRRGIAQIRHPGTSRDNRASLYYQVAEFGTSEAVEFLAETYEEEKRRGPHAGYPHDGPDLIMMLWGIPRPESADVLLRMLQDGRGDLRLIDAYTAVAGTESVPHLRRLLDKPPNETVRYGAWRALLHYKEPRAVADYLAELRPRGEDPTAVQYLCDLMDWAPGAKLTEAIPSLQALLRHKAPDGGRYLRHRIIPTLLRLGHWASVPDAIETLPEYASAGNPAIASSGGTPAALREVTGQDFGSDVGRWRRWWEEHGRHQAGTTSRSATPSAAALETTEAVEQAFLLWAMSPAGRVVPGPVVYAQDQGGQRRSTETIRYYREAELRLLDVPRIRIDGITIKGDTAEVSYYGPDDFHGPGPTAELVRGPHGWTVKGQFYRSDILPGDGSAF
jgi:hypothetical protein